jgi:hypothetical protein
MMVSFLGGMIVASGEVRDNKEWKGDEKKKDEA